MRKILVVISLLVASVYSSADERVGEFSRVTNETSPGETAEVDGGRLDSNKCSFQAFRAAVTISKINGYNDILPDTKAMVRGMPIANSSGLVYVYRFNPINQLGHVLNVDILVVTILENNLCTITKVETKI